MDEDKIHVMIVKGQTDKLIRKLKNLSIMAIIDAANQNKKETVTRLMRKLKITSSDILAMREGRRMMFIFYSTNIFEYLGPYPWKNIKFYINTLGLTLENSPLSFDALLQEAIDVEAIDVVIKLKKFGMTKETILHSQHGDSLRYAIRNGKIQVLKVLVKAEKEDEFGITKQEILSLVKRRGKTEEKLEELIEKDPELKALLE